MWQTQCHKTTHKLIISGWLESNPLNIGDDFGMVYCIGWISHYSKYPIFGESHMLTHSPLFTHYGDKSLIVNEIWKFFAHKIVKIPDKIDAKAISTSESISDDPSVDEAHLFPKFQPLSQSDDLKLIQKSSKKSCSLDPMPTKLVLASLEQLLPVITQMINSSLLSGHFQKLWREALVDPRQRKAGISDFSNLLPVSNLQYVSKLTERAVFDQVLIHLTTHDLYPKLQSA